MSSRVVVVTGASSGIGRAAALAFAARGDRLVLAARSRDDLEKVAAACGTDPIVVPADVTRREDLEQVRERAIKKYGRIDVWADSAAVMAYGKFEELPPEVFDRMVTTDLLGPANVARTALAQFREQGHGTLILTGSLLGHVAVPYMSAYVTSKWGARGLTRVLRQETRDNKRIHVCSVDPGSVDTPIYTSAANYAGFVGRPPPPVDSAERVAARIVRQADRPRPEASVGATNRLIEFGFNAFPSLYDALVTPLMRRGGLSRQAIAHHDGNVFAARPREEGGPGRWSRAQVGLAVAGVALATGAAVKRLHSRGVPG
ncbi:SDR family NAD(P)-dependent oxidoreductase [Paractinoplanes lichenicola]|uniref:SDR family NAD(P)-dependent oxidoreductase n=1 Tax=Paractinoplanes lichenicola TaxID=2802976 RepID=A0ABS1VLP7_9ACTN|nr:SDR family NAD(P)-dependent oxidoreductase [Actinoplanes lichenicola]MBL7255523.1 SDR family NAD(P)-dependent oxidoreductase [Actinoplanes lichenicola]